MASTRSLRLLLLATVFSLASNSASMGAIYTTYYGDDDGFGVGITSGSLSANPFGVNNASLGEAALTDRGLIGAAFPEPGFLPAGSFGAFAIGGGETIVSASLTIRTGAFDPIIPVVPPNLVELDGATVSPAFFLLFTDKTGFEGTANLLVETVTFALAPSFFPLLADGSVNLSGTSITEGSGSGSFMVDFLRLDIVTDSVAVVPEPASMAIWGLGALGCAIGAYRRRKLA